MATTLDMKSARNVLPISNFATSHGYKTVELINKRTSSGKEVHRLRFDGINEYKVSPKAYRLISEGEYSIMDLQYAEYCTEENPQEWVALFVPSGSRIISEDVLAKETF